MSGRWFGWGTDVDDERGTWLTPCLNGCGAVVVVPLDRERGLWLWSAAHDPHRAKAHHHPPVKANLRRPHRRKP